MNFNFQETQTEIVLKIFLRLIEDVITFQNVPTQRRREIMQGLTAHMGELFEFFMNLLQNHTSTANSLVSQCIVLDSFYQINFRYFRCCVFSIKKNIHRTKRQHVIIILPSFWLLCILNRYFFISIFFRFTKVLSSIFQRIGRY